MKKILKGLLIVCSFMFYLTGCKKKTDFTVGICQLVQHDALDKATQGFIDALELKVKEAGKTITIDKQNASNDSGTCTSIVNKFVSKKYNLIMANATPALQAACSATLDIPILGTSVTEYGVALGINDFNGTVGGNISGTSDLAPLTEQANMFEELLPSANRIGIIYCNAEANSKYQADTVKAILENKGKTVSVSTFTDSNDLSSVLTGLCNNVDAIYVPTDNVCASNTSLIYGISKEKRIPIIAGEESICKGCGIATLSISYYNIGYKTGEMAADILLNGKNISEMAIEYDQNPVKKYNEEACNEFGVSVPSGYTKID